ncbi:hypothetical protein KEM48_014557 [Puccinia striiformis f. sp. tritici PST-130]|nr:hypothetical protein Pst134EB_002006 [Puccinia striiformis f. sp. tritici]KAI9600986.1 hypothetical protein H4Q26_000780 [Puccinia striiformis f. sp. tritici PST-130]KAI9631628.1 hypothetical protein KEM48_014557 [Puccinia striiformis f. sp. tritici PST-130]
MHMQCTVESRADAEFFTTTAPKLEAAKSHQDGQLSKPPTKTLALRIADPKDDIVRKLASRITNTLVEDLTSPGTNEDEVFA